MIENDSWQEWKNEKCIFKFNLMEAQEKIEIASFLMHLAELDRELEIAR